MKLPFFAQRGAVRLTCKYEVQVAKKENLPPYPHTDTDRTPTGFSPKFVKSSSAQEPESSPESVRLVGPRFHVHSTQKCGSMRQYEVHYEDACSGHGAR